MTGTGPWETDCMKKASGGNQEARGKQGGGKTRTGGERGRGQNCAHSQGQNQGKVKTKRDKKIENLSRTEGPDAKPNPTSGQKNEKLEKPEGTARRSCIATSA